jgi:hypothetical protein
MGVVPTIVGNRAFRSYCTGLNHGAGIRCNLTRGLSDPGFIGFMRLIGFSEALAQISERAIRPTAAIERADVDSGTLNIRGAKETLYVYNRDNGIVR